MKHIVDSGNFRGKDIGTKALNLFIMRENSINVPSLFCIGSGLLEGYLPGVKDSIERTLEQIDFSDPNDIAAASENIGEMISVLNENVAYKQDVFNCIHSYFKGVEKFAVRSSATVEDSAEASFAGQFATYTGVSINEMATGVTSCFTSLYEPNVLKYCHEKNVPFSALRMNVVIQEWIEPEQSGVMFTVNPQGLLNESVIVAGAGGGDNVVKDKVPTTAYYYNLTDNIFYYESQENAPLLNNKTIQELIQTASRIKPLFGEYLDIEFAVKADEIYILQARPITSLKLKKSLILDNSNIVESYPGISLPLTDSFVCEAYYQVFRGLASRCLKNDKLLKGYDGDLRNMVGTANGRMYYKISNWYAVLNFMPMSKKIIPVWQDMMGVTNKEHEAYKKELSFFQNIATYFNCVYEAFHIQKGMRKLNDDFIDTVKCFNAGYKTDLPVSELINLYNSISARILSNWDITLLNDIYAFLFTGLLKNKLKKLKIENYEAVTNACISGAANLESMKPVKALTALASAAVSGSSVGDLKLLQNDKAAQDYFYNNDTAFCIMCRDFIEVYGDRSLEELKLESETFRTSPLMLVQKILEYTADPARLEDIIRSISAGSEPADIKHTGNAIDKRIIAFYSKKAMLGISNREISRLNRSRIYGIVRTLFLDIGRRMRDDGRLESEKDIFYLYTGEVFHDDGKTDFKNMASKRKQEYDLYQKLPTYSRLVFNGEIFNKNHANINAEKTVSSADEISGIPCSNGIVEGEVLIVDSPQTALRAKDKILVTKMTDPGWVFLITLAKGIIAEKGSLLSHTAIISRELNVPSIVGVKNITNILKTGDIVRMNGSTGKIELVRDENG